MLPLRLALATTLLLGAPALAQERPVLSGAEVVYAAPSGRFVVHYTLAGGDAPSDLTDAAPANGVPDLVDDIAAGIDHAWDVFVGEDGWPPPPPDAGRGGDDRLDVYVRTIDSFGYTYYEPTADATAHTSHLELSNTIAGMGPVAVRSIAAHELHHALQAALTTALAPWIFEATAAWAQYLLYSDDFVLDAGRDALWLLRLQGATRAFDDTGARFDYAGMIWLKFLLDQGSWPRRTVLDLWQAMAAEADWARGHEHLLPQLGLPSLAAAVETFAEWNLFACQRADGHHYAAGPPACGIGAQVRTAAVAAVPATGATVVVGPLGQAYLDFAHDCQTAALTVHVDGPGAFAARAVEVRGGGASTSRRAETAGAGGVDVELPDWNNAGRAVVIVVNRDAQPATFAWTAAPGGAYAPVADPATAQQVTLDAPTGPALGPTLVLDPGATRALRARAFFGSCADGADVTAAAAWQARDPGVATVAAGVVRAVAPGRTEITATAGAAVATLPVEVPGAGCACAAGGAPGAGGLALGALVLLGLRQRRGSPTAHLRQRRGSPAAHLRRRRGRAAA
ncbi:MAG TPA: hypothetical protein VGQ83_00230 [Polyangia bacterium]|jgi:MYXO-CTERM domain-containing protein